jgi:hypothetical protein
MNNSEKLKIALEALNKIDWIEENSPSTVSIHEMFSNILKIARDAIYEIEKEELPICESSSTAEHIRLNEDNDACDDGRKGK